MSNLRKEEQRWFDNIPKFNENPIKLLWYSDSALVSTGFGVVANNILFELWKTGKYEIFNVGINDLGFEHEMRKLPGITFIPVPQLDIDPYGYKVLPRILRKNKFDIIVILNDIWLVSGDQMKGNENWWYRLLAQYAPHVPTICMSPIDGGPLEIKWLNALRDSWSPVVYSKYGYDLVLKQAKDLADRLSLIYHGVDLNVFKPLPDAVRQQVKKEMGVPDGNKLIGIISRNQPRKNIPLGIRIFKMLRDGYKTCNQCGGYFNLTEEVCELCGHKEFTHRYDGYKNVSLYLHMNLRDGRGANLPKIIIDEKAEGIVFPQDHDIAHGVPADYLNAIYNACDVTFIPTTAEGFCLPAQESEAAGTPVVGTRTTALTELLEDGGGIPVNASDYFIADDAANVRRHTISIPESIKALRKVLEDDEYRESLAKKALEYTSKRSWSVIGNQFDELISKTLDKRVSIVDSFKPDKELKILFDRPYGSAGDILLTTAITRAFKRRYSDSSITYSVPSKYMELLENNTDIDNIVPFEYMWEGSRFLNSGKVRIAKFDLFGVEDKVESALISRVGFSRQEIFANHCNVELNGMYLPSYRILDTERVWAEEYLKGDKNYKIAIKIDAESPHQSVSLETLANVAKHLVSTDHSIYAFVQDRDHAHIQDWQKYCPEGVKTVYLDGESKPYRKMIALINYMDLVIAPEGSFCHFAGMLRKKLIPLFGPTDVKQRLKHYDNVYPVVNKECQFLPCWRHGGVACRLNGRKDFSKCLLDIQAGTIVAMVLKAKKG